MVVWGGKEVSAYRGVGVGPEPEEMFLTQMGRVGEKNKPTMGVEPMTCRLRIGCSTSKLRWRNALKNALKHLYIFPKFP
jgi:hypothetical protein